jgi:hypothetical protein
MRLRTFEHPLRDAHLRFIVSENAMSLHDHSVHQDKPQGSFLTSRAGLVLLAFLAIASVLLFTEHRAHALGASLWLVLLACPLLHLFMHGGHGSHGNNGRPGPDRQPAKHQH